MSFAVGTAYFAPDAQTCVVNFRLDTLDMLLAQLRADGVTVDDRIEEGEYGRFGWNVDPDGNRVERWQPAAFRITQTISATINSERRSDYGLPFALMECVG